MTKEKSKNLASREQLHVRISSRLLAELEIETYDPRLVKPGGKMPYNLKSSLVERALHEYFVKLMKDREVKSMDNKVETKVNIPESALTDKVPESMSPQERQIEILEIRRRRLNGEDLDSAVIQRGILLIRAERNDRTGKVPTTKKAGRPKKQVEAFTLEHFAKKS